MMYNTADEKKISSFKYKVSKKLRTKVVQHGLSLSKEPSNAFRLQVPFQYST
jgi:hypothetical protein